MIGIARATVDGQITVGHCVMTGVQEISIVSLNRQDGDLYMRLLALGNQSGPAKARRMEIPARSLDTVLSSHPDGVNVLRMDVEAAQHGIIESSKIDQLIHIMQLALECHDTFGQEVGQLADRSTLAGPVWKHQEQSGRPGQGLGWWHQQ